MNRKERRIARSGGKDTTLISFRGNSYTVDEACALAVSQLQIRNFQEALAISAHILASAPNHAVAHNNQGITLHIMGHYDEALASFNRCIAIKPDYTEAYNNRCVTLQTMKRHAEAMADCQKAIALKPDYAAAYYNMGISLQLLGRHGEAIDNYDKALALNPSHAETCHNKGASLLELKRYNEALVHFDKAITLRSNHVEAYNNQSIALHELNRYPEALASYDKALELRPDYAEAYNNRSVTLQAMKQYDKALASCQKAIALKPDYAGAYYNQGISLQSLRRYEESIASYNKAIALNPNYTKAYNNLGDVLVNKGDMAQAEKMFRAALALQPDFAKALYNLAHIVTYRTPDHADIKHVLSLFQTFGDSLFEKEYLYFALGKMYNDCGLYDEAFEAYAQANRICNASVSYNMDKSEAATSQIIHTFSKEFLARETSFASQSRQPLFIVGMPRSGTTLIANILSNHPSVRRAGELPTITEATLRLPKLVESALAYAYPQVVTQMTPAAAATLIADYEARLQRGIDPATPYIIDKHPLNFWHLGLIAMLFPKARIIHCTRHPMDIVLSNYFQHFDFYYDYSFDLQNIAHFYQEYSRMMAHWRQALPHRILDVSYEDTVADMEGNTRRMLEFLELEWNDRCLAPHTNTSGVDTASRWQVRQPVYNKSVARWQHYETHLAPLRTMLPSAA